MSRLTKEEIEALRAAAGGDFTQPPLRPHERFVAPTPEARARFIEFCTQASRFHKGVKPVRFGGRHWKL